MGIAPRGGDALPPIPIALPNIAVSQMQSQMLHRGPTTSPSRRIFAIAMYARRVVTFPRVVLVKKGKGDIREQKK